MSERVLVFGMSGPTLDFVRARSDVSGTKVGAMCFCIGGHMTYLQACQTDVAAEASYYGGGTAAPEGPGGRPSTGTRTSKLHRRIQRHFRRRDLGISPVSSR